MNGLPVILPRVMHISTDSIELQWQWAMVSLILPQGHPHDAPVHLYRLCLHDTVLLLHQGCYSGVSCWATTDQITMNTPSEHRCLLQPAHEAVAAGSFLVVLILSWDHHCLHLQSYGVKDVSSCNTANARRAPNFGPSETRLSSPS